MELRVFKTSNPMEQISRGPVQPQSEEDRFFFAERRRRNGEPASNG